MKRTLLALAVVLLVAAWINLSQRYDSEQERLHLKATHLMQWENRSTWETLRQCKTLLVQRLDEPIEMFIAKYDTTPLEGTCIFFHPYAQEIRVGVFNAPRRANNWLFYGGHFIWKERP